MKILKKTIIILLLALLTINICACNNDVSDKVEKDAPLEETNERQPNPPSDFKYTIDSEKKEIRINKYIGTSKVVVIPSKIENMSVVAIEGIPIEPDSNQYEGVFYNTGVVTVVIPETVRVIGFASFGDCIELTQVTFKNDSGLLSIGRTAFSGCVNLEKIDFSTTKLKMIDMYAFRGCSNLKEIKFSDTLEQIGEGAFYECSSLIDVKLPPNVTKLGSNAFAHCISLKRINIPAKLNLNFFEGSALNNIPALNQIVFDEGREEIVGYALVQTEGNVEVIVPKGVRNFSPLIFFFNSPSKITITFLGDAPKIIEENKPAWLEGAVLFYDPETIGWETFVWKDNVEMKIIQEN